jgi:3-oxoacyl-[acyl-carrier protein] reductase
MTADFMERLKAARTEVWEKEPDEVINLLDASTGYTDTWDSVFFPTLYSWLETVASRNVLNVIRKTLVEEDLDLDTVRRVLQDLLTMYVPFLKWANLPDTTELFREASESVTEFGSREQLIEFLEEFVLYLGRLNYRIEPLMPWPELIRTFNAATSQRSASQPILDFTGKTVLLTGAAGTIGAAAAELFLQRGAKVIGTDSAFVQGDDHTIDFNSNPVKIGLDVTDRNRVADIIDLVVENAGGIDVVVNAAGILDTKPFLDISDEEWDKVFAVNVKGMFLVCQAALKHMMERKRGCFVNFASISGKVGGVLAGADYSASKAAVICLTKSLAKTGAPYGIRANSVAPGAIYSPMLDIYYQEHAEEMKSFEANHPFGRFGKAVEVANAVLFLASDEASYITGVCLDINGGTLMD